ncbi:hypothetical protein VTP01DRAFT_25 [Rhizomucor pusillus]|uniref:uncharacterized protein n=1 Tax=Rhizomucor pusillus TaxID=4840 RepID=UPI003743AFB4
MGHDIKLDPAIERWAHLRENTHLYFRWNKTTAGRSFLWLVAVPIGLTYLAAQTQTRWNFAAPQTKQDMYYRKETAKEADN